jgi:hypothetical protein
MSSIIWNTIITSFDMVGDNLAWRIGNVNKVRLSLNPWPGSGGAHNLPANLLHSFHTQGYLFLNHIADTI